MEICLIPTLDKGGSRLAKIVFHLHLRTYSHMIGVMKNPGLVFYPYVAPVYTNLFGLCLMI